jgi:hypothetical protein
VDRPPEDVSLCEVLRCIAGGFRETYVCDVLSSGFGSSVLTFFGERGPVPVGPGGGPEWSGVGRLGTVQLGTWRSSRAGLGGLLGTVPSM